MKLFKTNKIDIVRQNVSFLTAEKRVTCRPWWGVTLSICPVRGSLTLEIKDRTYRWTDRQTDRHLAVSLPSARCRQHNKIHCLLVTPYLNDRVISAESFWTFETYLICDENGRFYVFYHLNSICFFHVFKINFCLCQSAFYVFNATCQSYDMSHLCYEHNVRPSVCPFVT